jgi:hypothetical protein
MYTVTLLTISLNSVGLCERKMSASITPPTIFSTAFCANQIYMEMQAKIHGYRDISSSCFGFRNSCFQISGLRQVPGVTKLRFDISRCSPYKCQDLY